jgi:hypothetical protein
MSKIPIKVKKDNLPAEQVSDELKVDLRDSQETEQKQPSRKWLFLSIFLSVIIIILALGWRFSASQKMAFTDLVPENAVVFSLINQEELYPQMVPFSQFLRERNFYGQGTIDKLNDYFNQSQLNFSQDIQPLFKKEMAFILLPADSETTFPFILLFEKNASLAQISQVLSKIEPIFKQDYNLSPQVYRQIEITALDPLFSSPFGYVYAQIGDYFIIGNSQNSLEKMIDLIINR